MSTEELTKNLIKWIKNWFDENGPDCKAIIGISGGKDSTITAKLCVEALGKDRIIGILMPNGTQKDINDSYKVVETLGIYYIIHNIETTVHAVYNGMLNNNQEISKQTITNLPPRIRMATLYAYSQSLNGRVVGTCNLSEEIVGYSTIWGDSVADCMPLANITVTELLKIGDYLQLPPELVHKAPIDGLNTKKDGSYVTDEDNLGVTYAEIDKYIGGFMDSSDPAYVKIVKLQSQSAFKRKPIATFNPSK